jgi:hypothetical protein
MIFALALLVSATAGGMLATYWYEDDASLGWRTCAGAVTGITALGFVGLLISTMLGLAPVALVVTAIAVGSPVAMLLNRAVSERIRKELSGARSTFVRALREATLSTVTRVVVLVSLVAVIWRVNTRAVFERADGLYTGVTNNIGDLPFHIAVATRFLYQNNLPPENPTYAGAHFAYPILADFVAAMIDGAGADLRTSLISVNVVLMCALVGVVYQWVLGLTADRRAATLAPALVLLNGGLGWWVLVGEVQSSDIGIVATLARLPHDYTIMSEGNWRWGNMITALLLPQRAFLFGLPLAILVFTLWRRAFDASQATDAQPALVASRRRMLAAGLIAGMMPLAHAHSYAVVMAVAGCVAIMSGRIRVWLPFFVTSLALGVPQIVWLASGGSVETARFVDWQFGWDRGGDNALWFWLKNTGALIPLVAVAILWRGPNAPVPASILRFYFPFVVLFVIGNVLRLSPWIWDNIKILIYWHVASVPLVAAVLARLWSGSVLQKTGSALLMVVLTAAGALDVWRVVSGASEHRVFSRDGIVFAELVRRTVPAGDLILHAPTYDHPVFLAGRRSFMGYPGHVWSHGLSFESREADIKRIYAGAGDAMRLMDHYGISYIVVGPLEYDQLKVGDDLFRRLVVVGRVGSYVLFRVASSAD